MTLSELQTKRETLIGRIADAVSRLDHGDKSVSYQTITEMQKALEILDNEIVTASGSTRSPRTVLIQHSNG